MLIVLSSETVLLFCSPPDINISLIPFTAEKAVLEGGDVFKYL